MKKTTPAVVCVDSDQVMELEVGLGWVGFGLVRT